MLGPILCGQLSLALLLPKLRSHFAEFLNNASPVGLSILSSSTCVGLRYGHVYNNSGFSWQLAHTLPYFFFGPHHVFGLHGGFAFRTPTSLAPGFPFPVVLSHCVPTVLYIRGTGISTCCPSTTSFDLALGPDLPRADQLYSGNLRYSAGRIPTFLSLLIPAFSLLKSPQLLTVLLRPFKNAPLPIEFSIPKLRQCVLAPDIFGAGPLD